MNTIVRVLVLAVTAVLVTLVPTTPSHAVTVGCLHRDDINEYVGRARNALCWPDPSGTTIVLEAHGGTWGMRAAARYVDENVTGLQIISDVGVRCVDYPTAHCVTVVQQSFPNSPEAGWYSPDVPSMITLNTAHPLSALAQRKTSRHEFLHVLGFAHHTDPGLMGMLGWCSWGVDESGYLPGCDRDWLRKVLPSNREMEVLQAWYGGGAQ